MAVTKESRIRRTAIGLKDSYDSSRVLDAGGIGTSVTIRYRMRFLSVAVRVSVCPVRRATGAGTEASPEVLMANGHSKSARAIVQPAFRANPHDTHCRAEWRRSESGKPDLNALR